MNARLTEVIASLIRGGRPDLANRVARGSGGLDLLADDTFETDPPDDETVAIETPKKYRDRTNRCPPGYRSNDKPICIDMKERDKKRRWEKQQRAKERREKRK